MYQRIEAAWLSYRFARLELEMDRLLALRFVAAMTGNQLLLAYMRGLQRGRR